MNSDPNLDHWLRTSGPQIRRRVRILMLLDAADYSVISPIPLRRFHALAFLADVLSPNIQFCSNIRPDIKAPDGTVLS